MRRTQASRTARAAALAIACALSLFLSGCFLIPLADGRSPFDDPAGTSNRDLKRAIPKIEASLKGLDDREAAWLIDTKPGKSYSCEGACQLHVEVSISPAREGQDLTIPTSLLREVLQDAVPVAEAEKVDLEVLGWYSDRGELAGSISSSRAEMADAAAELFGGRGSDPVLRDGYSVNYTLATKSASVMALTRTHTGVLKLMGLDSASGRQ